MKLYEISTIFANLQAEIEDGDPDQATHALAKIDAIEGAFTDKAQQIGFVVKNMEAMADAVSKEAEAMAARSKAINGRIASVKEYLRSNMERAAVKTIECPQFKITLKNNPPRVSITDEKVIPAEYMRTPEPPPPSPDKKKMLEDLKEGVVIDGAELAFGNRVEIK